MYISLQNIIYTKNIKPLLCLQHVGDSRWRELIVPAGNKAKRFSLVYHTTRTIHHHHHHHHHHNHHHHCLMFKIKFESLSLYNLLTLESINAEEFHVTHHLQNILFSVFDLLCDLMSMLKVKSKHLLLHYVVRAKYAVFKSFCK